MIKIRLSRRGSHNKPFYRIVAVDERKKVNAPALEVLGYWYPSTSLKNIEKAKITKWLAKGAKLTPAVAKLIQK